MIDEEITWQDAVSGNSVVPITLRVLRGEATMAENVFVFMRMAPAMVLAIAVVNGIKKVEIS